MENIFQNPKYQIWTWYFGGRNIVICICCNSQWFNKSSLLGQWYRFILASSSAMSWQEQDATFQWDDDGVFFVLDQPSLLDFYDASSLKKQTIDRNLAPLGHIILILSSSLLVCQWMGDLKKPRTGHMQVTLWLEYLLIQ